MRVLHCARQNAKSEEDGHQPRRRCVEDVDLKKTDEEKQARSDRLKKNRFVPALTPAQRLGAAIRCNGKADASCVAPGLALVEAAVPLALADFDRASHENHYSTSFPLWLLRIEVFSRKVKTHPFRD